MDGKVRKGSIGRMEARSGACGMSKTNKQTNKQRLKP